MELHPQSSLHTSRTRAKTNPAYDVLVDLSTASGNDSSFDGYVNRLACDGGLTGTAQVTLALPEEVPKPPGPSGLRIDCVPAKPPAAVLERTIRRAAFSGHHLVVLLGAVIVGNEVLARLIDTFEEDPLIGTAQPRFAAETTDLLWPLPGSGSRESVETKIPRSVLPLLSPNTITAELLSACVVIRWSVLAGIEAIGAGYTSISGAVLHLLCQARRRGFRNFVVNHAVVSLPLPYESIYLLPPTPDLDRLGTLYPDSKVAEAEFELLPRRRLEPLLAAGQTWAGNHRRMLLDCRGMISSHNGTSKCVHGFLTGFAMLDSDWQTDILVSPTSAEFHRLSQLYPDVRQLNDQPVGEYAAAVRLNQPWALDTVAELHRHALLIVFNMLDTIAWDVIYPTPNPAALADVWHFTARYADALLFLSQFGRDRFNARFPVQAGVREQVTHLSLVPDEYTNLLALKEPPSDHILIFGNEYDHKDLGPCLRTLADAFPFNRIIVFGVAGTSKGPNVVQIASGQIDQSELQRLISTARVIVYPSYSEGFGLPVVEGLAYGRTVIVRRSQLWSEIAAWSRLPGELIEFDDSSSLVEWVGKTLAGTPGQGLQKGVALAKNSAPAGWRDCVRTVISLLDECLTDADGNRWLEREETLRLAGF